MPGAGEGEECRVVVDESGFDFRALHAGQLTALLDEFNDTLQHTQGKCRVATSPVWEFTECREGIELFQFLYEGAGADVARDTRLRMARLLDRCQRWDDALDGMPDQVEVDGRPLPTAWSVRFACRQTLHGHFTACLAFPAAQRAGWTRVVCDESEPEIFFFSDVAGLSHFWRGLFARENVTERDFFDRAQEAFTGLVFAESLTFRKFRGSYRDVRDWVVHALGVVDDHFTPALEEHSGKPDEVQAYLAQFGLELSPESPRTRANKRAMRQRDVEHEGETFRCEWHAKRHPAWDRIHFSLPKQRLGGRILVGIFVDHLDT